MGPRQSRRRILSTAGTTTPGNGAPVSWAENGQIVVDDRFLNRELSWLAFNERVLELASEPGIPLLERAKFCAITSQNLD